MTDAPDPGSVPLTNARWEAFCIAYVGSGNATQAYLTAGYKAGPAAGVSAHHLLKNPNVEARIHNLRQSKWRELHMTADELLAAMAGQVRFSMGNIVHITPDGDPYIDLSKASPDDMACLTEVSIEDFTDGREVDEDGNTIKRDVRRVKVKAPNKMAAATLLARNLGLLKDRVEVTLSEDFAETMQRARERAKAARAAREGDKT